MRKPFDDATGKHVAKEPPPVITLDEIMESLVNVLAEPCTVCKAEPGKPCTVVVGKQGERTYPHPARVESARSKS